MKKTKEIIESFDKQELVNLVLELGFNRYYPMELFVLRADYPFKAKDLEKYWKRIKDWAYEYDKEDDRKGADYLGDASDLLFEQIKKLKNKEDQRYLLKRMVNELEMASEVDGIGMRSDSEWLYYEVKEKIEEYLAGLICSE